MKTFPVKALILLVLVLFLDVCSCAAPLAASAVEESWYVTAIGGAPVGYVHEARESRDGEVRLRNDFRIVLNRMGSKIEMSVRGASRESEAGLLVSSEMEMTMSEQTTSVKAVAGGGSLSVESQAGGRAFQRDLPFEGELLGPDAVRRLTMERLRRPDDRIDYQIFSPELSTVAKASRRMLGTETVTIEGERIEALRLEEEIEGLPVKSTVWLAPDGSLLRSEQPGPFGVMSVLRANEAAARMAEGGGELPEESYGSTLARTQIRIPDPRRLDRLEIALHHRNPALGWPEMSGPGQEVLDRSADTLTLAISRPAPATGHAFPVAANDENREYLEPNAYVQSEDPDLRSKALEIVGGEKDLYRAALKLERWVAENMAFDMGVVLAPSVEVFANRRGTCTEYAMLLTTMARAVGIPSRFVMGYVYADGIFGGHAWTEVLAGDSWIPIDGAVITEGPADAGRFAFKRTSLRDGVNQLSMGPGMQLYGQIDLEVLAYTLHGEARRSVPPGSVPYSVIGNRYVNNGLGLSLDKPSGFEFAKLDGVWPETTLVELDGPDGQRVKLEARVRRYWQDPREHAVELLRELAPRGSMSTMKAAGAEGYVVTAGDRAVLAVPGSETTWLLHVTGPGAAKLLRKVASSFELRG